jgi:hypothetical protein
MANALMNLMRNCSESHKGGNLSTYWREGDSGLRGYSRVKTYDSIAFLRRYQAALLGRHCVRHSAELIAAV